MASTKGMDMQYSKWKGLGKGLLTAVVTHVALQLQAADMTEVLADPEAWGLTVAAGLVPAVLNAWKNRDMKGSPFHRKPKPWRPNGMVWLVGLAGTLVMALAGCVTTTLPDGTVVEELDPRAVALGERLVSGLLAELEEEDSAGVESEEVDWPDWLVWLVDSNGDGVLTQSEVERQARVFGKAKGEG